MSRSAIINVMVQAALKAGRSLVRDFNELSKLQVTVKKPGDYVSSADHRAENIIYRELLNARPDYGFLMEEKGTIIGKDSQHRWIVDPLDGTTNFLHGIPFFAVSIALERQGVLVASVIYNPISDELFTAEKGAGVFLNDRRIRVASQKKLEDCIIGTGIPDLGRPRHGQYLIELKNVMARTAGIRRYGAAALDLAWVAAGRLDGFWESNLAAWDMAAAILMIKEAGGFVSDIKNGSDMLTNGSIVAGNEYIHKALLDTLHKPL